MGHPALRIRVKPKDQNDLVQLWRGGVHQVSVVLRSLALLQSAKVASAPAISEVIPLTPQAIRRIGHRFQAGGLKAALYDKHRPGAAVVLDASQSSESLPWFAAPHQKAAPAGLSAWWRRRPSSESWSPVWAGNPSEYFFSTTTSSRGGKKMWWCAGTDDDCIAQMEDVLEAWTSNLFR